MRIQYLQSVTFTITILCISFTMLSCRVQPGFTGVGFVKSSSPESQALAVSRNGKLVVGSYGYNEPLPDFHHQGKPFASSFSSGVPLALNELPTLAYTGLGGPGGQAMGISEEGSFIVGYSYIQESTTGEAGFSAVRWTKPFTSTGVERLLPLTGFKFSRAVSVSKNSVVIVGYSMQTPLGSSIYRKGCYWKTPFAAAPTALTDPAGAEPETSWPTSISSTASAIVGSIMLKSPAGTLFRTPLIWTGPAFIPQVLPLLPGTIEGMAIDVNITGTKIVGNCKTPDGNYVPCVWQLKSGAYHPTTIPNLPPGGVTGSASACSEEGDIIVGSSSIITTAGDYIPTAWIWSVSKGTRTLTDALTAEGITVQNKWISLQPLDISADGHYIVGYGGNPINQEEGWIATLQNP